MELIEGNYYSPHDLQTFMEVSESTWSHIRPSKFLFMEYMDSTLLILKVRTITMSVFEKMVSLPDYYPMLTSTRTL